MENNTRQNAPKKDLRIIRTKLALHEAMKQLVCELPYERITVKALTDRALVNRNTFYLHYESIDEFITEIQQDYTERYMEIVKDLDYLTHMEQIVSSFFYFMESQDEFFRKITCDSRYDSIRIGMQRKITAHARKRTAAKRGTKGKHDESELNIIQVYNNTVLQLYRQWVADGRAIPLKEMISLASTLLQSGIDGYVKKSRA